MDIIFYLIFSFNFGPPIFYNLFFSKFIYKAHSIKHAANLKICIDMFPYGYVQFKNELKGENINCNTCHKIGERKATIINYKENQLLNSQNVILLSAKSTFY